MEPKIYFQKIKDIELEASLKKKKLIQDFLKEQIKFRPGKIIKKDETIILIEEMGYILNKNIPTIVYKGEELKKNKKPFAIKRNGRIIGNENVILVK